MESKSKIERDELFQSRKQGRSWFVTINCTDGEEMFQVAKDNCIYAVGQIEVGSKSAREHIHMLVHFQTNKRFAAIKKLWPRADIEIPRNVADCINYCQKESTRVRGPFEFGVSPIEMVRSNFKYTVKKAAGMSEEELQDLTCQSYIAVKKALQLRPTEPTEHEGVRGLWIYGPPGTGIPHLLQCLSINFPRNINFLGKSWKAFTTYPGAYIKQQNSWFCGYDGEETIILDDLDCVGNREMGHNLKRWTDRYKVTAQKKFGSTGLRHKLFIVTSNYTPAQIWQDDPVLVEAITRRFKIEHMPLKFIPK